MKRQRIRYHYEKRVRQDRESYDILDWGSRESQEARFQVLLDTLEEGTYRLARDVPLRLLDVGCGLTDLCTYLQAFEFPVHYVGVDITFAILDEARRRWPERMVFQGDVFTDPPLRERQFDVAYCSGIFNLRLGNNEAFAIGALVKLLPLVRHCVVANFLHERTSRKYAHCHYYNPERIASSVRGEGAAVGVIDDYLENDFTLVVSRGGPAVPGRPGEGRWWRSR